MQFPFPHFPGEFEVPDEWWSEAGMYGYARRGSTYRSPVTAAIALGSIEPPFRTKALDANGFVRIRMVSILKGFADDAEILPIDLLVIPPLGDLSGDPFKYRVVDGFHRFYASIAAGFDFVPTTTRGVWT